MNVEIQVEGDLSQEFLYFWGYVVRGFDPRTHCQKCFIGRKIYGVRPTMAPGVPITIRVRPGQFVYLCGVCYSYELRRNFHMVGEATKGVLGKKTTHWGTLVEVSNFDELPIDPEPARRQFPHLGRKFLECRNFQFGAQYLHQPSNEQRALF